RGTTIVVVSHNLNAVRNMCRRTIVIHDAEMRFDGETNDAISLNHYLLAEPRPGVDEPQADTGEAPADIVGQALSFELIGRDAQPTKHVETGDMVTFVLRVRFDRDVAGPIVGFNLFSSAGVLVYGTSSSWRGEHNFAAGTIGSFSWRVPMWLATDSFTANAAVVNGAGATHIAPVDPLLFYVAGARDVVGVVDLGAEFSVEST
ncbi:MAG: Wzt carbohydrate-binding domain-containing protein, partial [Acidimicrobiales bacterium]